MRKKIKFKPRVSRIKLNPEQAVLICDCHNGEGYGRQDGWNADAAHTWVPICNVLREMNGFTKCVGPTEPGGYANYRWYSGPANS